MKKPKCKCLGRIGAYRLEETMLDGLLRITGPGVKSFALGSGKNEQLAKDLMSVLNKAYMAGYSKLAKSLQPKEYGVACGGCELQEFDTCPFTNAFRRKGLGCSSFIRFK